MRLLDIAFRLAAGESFTADKLRREYNVSRATSHRDIAIIADDRRVRLSVLHGHAMRNRAVDPLPHYVVRMK